MKTFNQRFKELKIIYEKKHGYCFGRVGSDPDKMNKSEYELMIRQRNSSGLDTDEDIDLD